MSWQVPPLIKTRRGYQRARCYRRHPNSYPELLIDPKLFWASRLAPPGTRAKGKESTLARYQIPNLGVAGSNPAGVTIVIKVLVKLCGGTKGFRQCLRQCGGLYWPLCRLLRAYAGVSKLFRDENFVMYQGLRYGHLHDSFPKNRLRQQ